MSHRNQMSRHFGAGFTLVELLVVIAIIGVLIGMAVPAMQNMRELSRRSNCQYNLVQLSLALSSYETRMEQFPVGTLADSGPINNLPEGYHQNWLIGLLPMMDLGVVYDSIDHNVSVYDPKNAEVRAIRLPSLLCPSATDVADNTTCYAGIHDSAETPIDATNNGVFRLNIPTRASDITDGLSYTVFVGEKLSHIGEDLGWMSGTRSSLRNMGHGLNDERRRVRGPQDAVAQVSETYVGGLASDHPGGLHLLMGGGEVDFRSNEMDRELLRQMATIADGELPIVRMTTEP
ncbi:putative major pilin subunit [Rubripirellula tenax]|uniref:Putative major pilin subunit n=1 Tax=Rubripirellula tenax TaxID=2528015 RepID=A0A5C6EBT4_9BACT|nr:DUF1559 domain-containing protein [Rubripirellula tenax]TWU47243.1 putative major pilin subunit [Rubripirellula tenax]